MTAVKQKINYSLFLGVIIFISFELTYFIIRGIKINIYLVSLFYLIDIAYFIFSIRFFLPKTLFQHKAIYLVVLQVLLLLSTYAALVCFAGFLYVNLSSSKSGFININKQNISLSLWRGTYILGFAIIYHVVRENIWRIKKENILVKEKAIAEKEKNELEIARLKSQMNPHLMSNGLGFIYQGLLTGADPKRIAETVLLLSEMSDYSLSADRESDVVTLQEDIHNIERYIRFQQLLHNEKLAVQYENTIAPEDTGQVLPPLLFLNFIENVFKHGDLRDHSNKTLIKFTREGRQIHLHTSNSCLHSPVVRSNRIGLENTRKRLNHYYPNNHNLNITITDQVYQVDLFITIWN